MTKIGDVKRWHGGQWEVVDVLYSGDLVIRVTSSSQDYHTTITPSEWAAEPNCACGARPHREGCPMLEALIDSEI